jgi:hypothetical protein
VREVASPIRRIEIIEHGRSREWCWGKWKVVSLADQARIAAGSLREGGRCPSAVSFCWEQVAAGLGDERISLARGYDTGGASGRSPGKSRRQATVPVPQMADLSR